MLLYCLSIHLLPSVYNTLPDLADSGSWPRGVAPRAWGHAHAVCVRASVAAAGRRGGKEGADTSNSSSHFFFCSGDYSARWLLGQFRLSHLATRRYSKSCAKAILALIFVMPEDETKLQLI